MGEGGREREGKRERFWESMTSSSLKEILNQVLPQKKMIPHGRTEIHGGMTFIGSGKFVGKLKITLTAYI